MNASFNAVILAHTVAALAAIALGAAMFLARKGTFLHRVAGRSWVALMLVVAFSSFWIKASGNFSWIHLLSVAVPVLLGAGVYFAIRRNFVRHQRMMFGVYAIGLGVAGVFTLLPNRLLGHMLWTTLGVI